MRRPSRCFRALFGTALIVLAGFDGGAQGPQTQTPPSFGTGIELVVIDATVLSRDGAPAEGLGTDDFVVTVDGSPRRACARR